jgi:hypothetical protein
MRLKKGDIIICGLIGVLLAIRGGEYLIDYLLVSVFYARARLSFYHALPYTCHTILLIPSLPTMI